MQKLPPDILRAHKGISFVGVTTTFFCHDGQGSFFMAKRSKKARDEQGMWEIGAGGLKWGQTAIENMRREAKEEYNADIKDEPLFIGYRDMLREQPDGTKTHWLALDFVAQVDRSQIKICEPDMFDDSGWFTLDNLPSPLHNRGKYFDKNRKILEDILSQN